MPEERYINEQQQAEEKLAALMRERIGDDLIKNSASLIINRVQRGEFSLVDMKAIRDAMTEVEMLSARTDHNLADNPVVAAISKESHDLSLFMSGVELGEKLSQRKEE